MYITGLCSITFRKLSPVAIINLVEHAGLDAIEWGGDVHVPHGDLARAREVRAMTAAAGIRVSSYGSYYRVGHDAPVPFKAVLETARELGAPMIRVWAGRQGSAQSDAASRARVVAESRRIAAAAAAAGIGVSCEFHQGTLTDTNDSAVALLREVAHANFGTYWQPAADMPPGARREGLTALRPWLTNLHVYTWAGTERRALREGAAEWKEYLRLAEAARPRVLLLEFARGDSPEAFLDDARCLCEWVTGQCPFRSDLPSAHRR